MPGQVLNVGLVGYQFMGKATRMRGRRRRTFLICRGSRFCTRSAGAHVMPWRRPPESGAGIITRRITARCWRTRRSI